MLINCNNVSLKISAVKKSQFQNDLPEIIFCGKSNVGKSSMINCLLNRKSLARTSAKPGKTATVNYYNVDGKLYFVDLPGYGYAKVSYEEKRRWSIFMEDYFAFASEKKLAVSIIDIRHKPTELDLDMARFLADAGIPFIVAATKADKLSKSAVNTSLSELEKIYSADFETPFILPFSSRTRQGKDSLWDIIRQAVFGDDDSEEI